VQYKKEIKMKIRYKTWYWGKYVIEGENGFSINQEGFELYDEEKHGWQHSEEYKEWHKMRYKKEN